MPPPDRQGIISLINAAIDRLNNRAAGLGGLRKIGTAPLDAAAGTKGTTVTTKGDLQTFDTANARLGVGTNGSALKADSTTALGVGWLAPSIAIATTAPAVNTPVTVPTGAVSYRHVFGDATLVPGVADAAVVTWQIEDAVGSGNYITAITCRLGIGLTAGGRDAYSFVVPAGRRYQWTAGGGATVGTEAIGTYSTMDV